MQYIMLASQTIQIKSDNPCDDYVFGATNNEMQNNLNEVILRRKF